MSEILFINFGVFIASFCMCDFGLKNFSPVYNGFKDLMIRFVFAIGYVANTLVTPIWIQKSAFPDQSPLLFVIGMPPGMILVAIQFKRMKHAP